MLFYNKNNKTHSGEPNNEWLIYKWCWQNSIQDHKLRHLIHVLNIVYFYSWPYITNWLILPSRNIYALYINPLIFPNGLAFVLISLPMFSIFFLIFYFNLVFSLGKDLMHKMECVLEWACGFERHLITPVSLCLMFLPIVIPMYSFILKYSTVSHVPAKLSSILNLNPDFKTHSSSFSPFYWLYMSSSESYSDRPYEW